MASPLKAGLILKENISSKGTYSFLFSVEELIKLRQKAKSENGRVAYPRS